MQIFRTDDKRVTKFIHGDGTETCIKTVNSVDYKPNHETGEVELTETDRNKYSVFISASKGCPMKCPFCYLTIDQVPFQRVCSSWLITNLKEALNTEATNEAANLADRYIKICWMGMGEAILNAPSVTTNTLKLLEWTKARGLAKGLDGVDISTVLPKLTSTWIKQFAYLNEELEQYPLNPKNKSIVNKERGDLVEYKNRSRFRLFYSLESAIQQTRDLIVPNAMPIADAMVRLLQLQETGVNVIVHHMFLDGMNDSQEEIEALVRYMDHFPNSELRILRYNKHEHSDIRESDRFEANICYLQDRLNNIKVQVSYGKDVKSACGQFIYNTGPELENMKVV